MQLIECFIRNVSFVAEKVNSFLYPVLNRRMFHTVLFHSFSKVWNMPPFKTGRLEQCRLVGLDCLVEDVYCYSEFQVLRSNHQATAKNNGCKRWCTKFENTEQYAYWRDVQKCDRLRYASAIEANKTIVIFLDVTLDLKSGKHYPYSKEGNIPYIRIFKPT